MPRTASPSLANQYLVPGETLCSAWIRLCHLPLRAADSVDWRQWQCERASLGLVPQLLKEKRMTTNSTGPKRNWDFAGLAAVVGMTAALTVLGCAASQPAFVEEQSEGDIAAGQTYALGTCAQCHNVTARKARLFGTLGAPDFYAVANAKTTSRLGLTAFLTTPHPTMPNLIIPDQDRRNVIAYILSMRPAKKSDPAGI
jgi:mono/diheme cytochrome c family protein